MRSIDPRKIKLTKYEQSLEDRAHEYRPVSKEEFEEIRALLERRKKDAVLNIRINQGDLDSLKAKAKKLGLKYQTFISEILHKIAHS
jgi:predicted DNA binding CopG/RHH family protein